MSWYFVVYRSMKIKSKEKIIVAKKSTKMVNNKTELFFQPFLLATSSTVFEFWILNRFDAKNNSGITALTPKHPQLAHITILCIFLTCLGSAVTTHCGHKQQIAMMQYNAMQIYRSDFFVICAQNPTENGFESQTLQFVFVCKTNDTTSNRRTRNPNGKNGELEKRC